LLRLDAYPALDGIVSLLLSINPPKTSSAYWASTMAKDTVTTTIQYLEWQDIYEREKPFLLLFDLPDNAKDRRTSNLVFKAKTLTLHDIRASETPLTLDENGFMVKQSTTQVTDFANRKYVDENYLPEAEKLLREQVEGVDRVYFFDWRVGPSLISLS
jgi:hypothetical protein